jgi:hypothetical protein
VLWFDQLFIYAMNSPTNKQAGFRGDLKVAIGEQDAGKQPGREQVPRSPMYLGDLAGKAVTRSFSSMFPPSSTRTTAELARRVTTMTNVQKFSRKLKAHVEEHKDKGMKVAMPPPKCLEVILKKINLEKPKETEAIKANKK